MRTRYCKIEGCKYYRGTSDQNVYMFRIPIEVEMRQKWDEILSTYRQTSGNLICMEHFNSNDLIIKSKSCSLKKGSLPSIFESANIKVVTELADDSLNESSINIDVANVTNNDEITTADAVEVSACEQCQILNDQLLAANNRCMELERVNLINDNKISQLSEELETLKNQLKRSDLARFALNNDFVDEKAQHVAERQKQILSCLAVGIVHRQSYPPVVRNFFIALKNISPAAHRFLRSEFNENVPSVGTITSWLSNSDINPKPGIQLQSLEMLKLKVAKKKELDGKGLVGALSFDEMAIHKMVQCVNGKMIGYENYPGIDRKTARLATQALVFLFTGINEDIQIPVAYYFVASSDSDEKSILLHQVICAVLKCGVVLTSVTFDGHRVNLKFFRDLGADLNVFSSTYEPSIVVDGCIIWAIFDPSHMQKLTRGTLGDNDELYDSDSHPIKWVYFKRLVQFKEKHNLGSIIKISQAHIDYQAKPMKVKLAVEILSKTNADLMEHFMDQGYSEFKGAEPLIKYSRIFNDVFDVFNSTTDSNGNILKNKLSVENFPVVKELFQNAIEYIKGLQIRTPTRRLVPLCESNLKTEYLGYIANMQNLLAMFNELVIEKKIVQSIATHKLSQDHLEVMFGKIRSLCGSNNNQNCSEFDAALKKLLANTAIQYSNAGNCTVLEQVQIYNPFSNISTITSRRPKTEKNNNDRFTPEEIEMVLEELSEIEKQSAGKHQLADLSDLNTAHIASIIELRIEARDEFPNDCGQCKLIFRMNEKIPEAFTTSINTRKACQNTYDICKAAEHILKMDILKGQFEPALIYQTIFSSLNLGSLYQESSCEDHSDQTQLIEIILQKYIRIKCNYLAKNVTLECRNKKVRSHSSKYI